MLKYIILFTPNWQQLSSVLNACNTAKQAGKLHMTPAAPPCLLCQEMMARKWLKSPILKCFREGRGPSWYYVAWRFAVVFSIGTAIARVIYFYQQGHHWIPTDTARGKWTSPGTNVFCGADWTGRPTYAYFVCVWFLQELSLPGDAIVIKLFRRGSPLLRYKGTGIASWNYRQKD